MFTFSTPFQRSLHISLSTRVAEELKHKHKHKIQSHIRYILIHNIYYGKDNLNFFISRGIIIVLKCERHWAVYDENIFMLIVNCYLGMQENLIHDDQKLILLASLSDSLEYLADSVER